MKIGNKYWQFIIPIFYFIAMVLVVYYAWNEHNTILRGGSDPLYHDLMANPAFIKRGFTQADILTIPSPDTAGITDTAWTGFKTTPLNVGNSLLPNLPKRTFLSPRGNDAEEFTIIIPVEIGREAVSLLETSLRDGEMTVLPGIFLACIGENWEVFFNGTLVRSEIHVSEKGRIREYRTLRDIYFPIDGSIVKQGTNILALRIIGDPASVNTGLFYKGPHYMDNYRVIQGRQSKFLLTILCGIFGFTGVCFCVFFLAVRKRREIFYLYFGLFSFLLCVYTAMRHGLIIGLIDSVVLTHLEYASLMLAMPVFYIFIESLGRGKVTKPAWGFLAFSLYFAITQFFFCSSYGDEAIYLWNVVDILFFTYVIIYDIVYFHFFDKQRTAESNDVSTMVILNIIVGTLTVYFCGIFELTDVLFFHYSYSLFSFSTFVVQIGMTIALMLRFGRMYKRLEQSNIKLEADFARSIVSTGQEHYEKMNEIYDTLRILRHDYKYHLGIIGDLVKSGDIENAKRYLGDVQAQTPENDLVTFCSNPIFNALMVNCAERCAKLGIKFNAQLAIPDTLSVSNYDMCIILGNLLENAMEACQKISGDEQGEIKIEARTQGAYLAVMVKNSFSGNIAEENGQPVSTKKNGGFGLRSVREIASHYDGHVRIMWDADTFTVYVMVRK